ncbi:MAG: Uncharacterised protein [Owenweeksia sp. TMED14]|nr:MAG: Uncharacterised protein [Owenweeksia sp. TMED14]
MILRPLLIILILNFSLCAQSSHFEIQPLPLVPKLAGSFGELRNHHFHSGVDLRTAGKIGQPVRAVTGGYVKRIVVRPKGFGWALYLAHPAGYTSVYAHLNDFKPALHEFIVKKALENKSNQIDLYPFKDEFPINAGDTIGWSGNSGSSSGPHLHFEWRDSRTEEPLNPVSYGLEIGDDLVEPKILAIHTSSGNKVKRLWFDTLIIKDWQDIGVEILEQQNINGPKLGIKSMSVWIEDMNEPKQQEVPDFSWEMTRFSFLNTRGADGHMQHNVHSLTRKRTYRIAPVYQPAKIWKDVYSFPGDGLYQLTIMIKTHSGQSTISKGPILRDSKDSKWIDKEISSNQWKSPAGNMKSENIRISWKQGTFMEPAQHLIYQETISASDFENTHTPYLDQKWICKPDLPVLKFIDFYWTPHPEFPMHLKSKAVIVGKDSRGSYKIVGTPIEGGEIKFRMKLWGDFFIQTDEVPPIISLKGITSFQGKKAISFNLKDNLLDITKYSVKINEKWEWAYYDAKNEELLIPLNYDTADIKIYAEDEAHNLATFEYKFQ